MNRDTAKMPTAAKSAESIMPKPNPSESVRDIARRGNATAIEHEAAAAEVKTPMEARCVPIA